MHGFWSSVELAELAYGPTGCGEVAMGGCLFAWNFCATRSTVLTEAERTRPNMKLWLHWRLAPSLPFKNSTGQKPCTALYIYIERERERVCVCKGQAAIAVTVLSACKFYFKLVS